MKVTMIIPSYWGRKRGEGWKKGDIIYDHPTPLDVEGTLRRTIESTSILNNKDFQLVIIGAATADEISNEVEAKITSIMKETLVNVEVLFFSHSHLSKVHDYLKKNKKEGFAQILSLKGYSNIRNLCTFLPHLLGSEVAILIDDDEIFEDPQFIDKALKYRGNHIAGQMVYAVTGYVINPDGDYLNNQEIKPWMTAWNQVECMNRAFKEFIGKEPRLKKSPFALGGVMVVHRDLFTYVPFDPNVTRGEDMDFLINAKMFGYTFYIDNQLSVRHRPPKKFHPTWKRLREDIFRFIYERAKLCAQEEMPNVYTFKVEELDPYPGEFLRDDLEEKIFKSNQMLAFDYFLKDDREGVKECMNNIYLAKYDAVPRNNPFKNLLKLQNTWRDLMEYFSNRKNAKQVCELIKFPG